MIQEPHSGRAGNPITEAINAHALAGSSSTGMCSHRCVLTKGLRNNDQVPDGMTHSGNQDRAAHVSRVLSHAHTEADLVILAGVFQREYRIGRNRAEMAAISVSPRKWKGEGLAPPLHIAVAVYAERVLILSVDWRNSSCPRRSVRFPKGISSTA